MGEMINYKKNERLKKRPCTNTQLVVRLKEKKMVIEDEKKAEKIIKNYGYRSLIIRYRKDFYNSKDKEYINMSIEDFVEIYKFDYDFKIYFFEVIGHIENILKSYFVQLTCNELKNYDYNILNKEIFNETVRKYNEIYNEIIKKYEKEYGKKHADTFIQSWKAFEIMPLSLIKKYYCLLKKEYRNKLAEMFRINEKDMKVYITSLLHIRNICAHNLSLYNAKFITLPTLKNKKETIYNKLGIEITEEGTRYCGSRDLFSILIVMKVFLAGENDLLKNLIDKLSKRLTEFKGKVNENIFNTINKYINFPNNWKEIIEVKYE